MGQSGVSRVATSVGLVEQPRPKQPAIHLDLNPAVDLPSIHPRQGAGPIAPVATSMTSPQTSGPYSSVPRGVQQPITPQSALESFRVMWPEATNVSKGRTSLDEFRSNPSYFEPPVFGFQTMSHYDRFPLLAPTLQAMNPVGGNNVAMLPPGNHPYALWEITYDGVLYLEQVLRCPTLGSHLTNSGLYLDLPVHTPQQDVLYERVSFLGAPNNFTDPRATLTYSMIWHHVAASLADLHRTRTSIEAKLERLRRWCRMAYDLNGFVSRGAHHRTPTGTSLGDIGLCLQYDACVDADSILPAFGDARHRGR